MKKDWENVTLMPEFDEQGVACYRLDGGDYLNEYYVVSEAETRKLLNTPEIVGYEVYNCLIPSTSQMLYYLKEQKKVTTANILSILRGALNYPLEESCYREHIRVHDGTGQHVDDRRYHCEWRDVDPLSALCDRFLPESRSKTSEYYHLYDWWNEGYRDPGGSDPGYSGVLAGI